MFGIFVRKSACNLSRFLMTSESVACHLLPVASPKQEENNVALPNHLSEVELRESKKVNAESCNELPLHSEEMNSGRNAGHKRPIEDQSSEMTEKRIKLGETSVEKADGVQLPFRKKKMALLLVYSGKGYSGMQRNPGLKTIESDLLAALLKAGVVTQEHVDQPGQQMSFQRAARTDKGVSAAGQVVSLKMFSDVANAAEKINDHLPAQVRVVGLKRATKGFDSKQACMARTYMYLLPTFAFAPVEQIVTEDYRVTDEIMTKVNEILTMYKGTHNFHNFTSGKKASDASARRFIMEFYAEPPAIRGELEYAVIKVKGQSFMLHQIRKMIGLMIAVVKGFAGVQSISAAFETDKRDVPRAPALGLMLDKCHYDCYNQRYGNDGLHEPIAWDQYKDFIDKFKEEFIYSTVLETERKEKSMFSWLATLNMHHFGLRKADTDPTRSQFETGVTHAAHQLKTSRKEMAESGAEPKEAKDEGEEGEKDEEDVEKDEAELADSD